MDVGKFEVSGGFLGRQIEKVELVFQVRGAGGNSVCRGSIINPAAPVVWMG